MPQTPHLECHFTGTATVRDIVIGMSDGPLRPYPLLPKASSALVASVDITLPALAVFGYVKGHFTGAPPVRSAIQAVLIGGVAAGMAFLIARAIS